MENASLDLILKVGLLLASIVAAYVTTKTTLNFFGKRQDEHSRKIDEYGKYIENLKLDVALKISRDHAFESFVTKEELNIKIENISFKQNDLLRKQDDILNILRSGK